MIRRARILGTVHHGRVFAKESIIPSDCHWWVQPSQHLAELSGFRIIFSFCARSREKPQNLIRNR